MKFKLLIGFMLGAFLFGFSLNSIYMRDVFASTQHGGGSSGKSGKSGGVKSHEKTDIDDEWEDEAEVKEVEKDPYDVCLEGCEDKCSKKKKGRSLCKNQCIKTCENKTKIKEKSDDPGHGHKDGGSGHY